MGIEVCISAGQLRRALRDIEAAEANGFDHCLAVLELEACGMMLDQCLVRYSDLVEKAHPTDGSLSWGRFQGVTRRYKFEGGQLVPLKPAQSA